VVPGEELTDRQESLPRSGRRDNQQVAELWALLGFPNSYQPLTEQKASGSEEHTISGKR
jgi:hypothetical protein